MSKYKRGMINLGSKPEVIKETSPPKTAVSYPRFYVSGKPLPIKNEEIGKMMTVTARIKLVGMSENSSPNKSEFSYNFEIHDITL